MKRITIYDVAKEANVSLATVSRVINGSDVVREDTRQKVQEAIENLGYKPNAIAQGLALQKTTSIAIVIPEASFFYTGQIINGLIDVAKIYKYSIVLHTTTEGITKIDDVIENIIKSRVDGVLIFNDKFTNDELDKLSKYQIPTVVIGNKTTDSKIGSVFVNYEMLAYDLVTSYLNKGKNKVALIEDRKNPAMVRQLFDGAVKAYEEKGLIFKDYIEIPKTYKTSYSYLKEYFKVNKPDVLIAYRDTQAIAVLNSSEEQGYKIPDDMELVCILDNKYTEMARPRISGYKIPDYDLGAVAMRVLTKMLNTQEEFDKDIELNYSFVKRDTTK